MEEDSSSSDDSSSLSSDVNGSSAAFSNKMAQLRHRPVPDEEAISSDSSLNESFEKKYLVNGGLTTSQVVQNLADEFLNDDNSYH